MENENWWWVPRDTLKSQTPDSLIVPSISYHVIKRYKYEMSWVCSGSQCRCWSGYFQEGLFFVSQYCSAGIILEYRSNLSSWAFLVRFSGYTFVSSYMYKGALWGRFELTNGSDRSVELTDRSNGVLRSHAYSSARAYTFIYLYLIRVSNQ